MLSKGRFRMHVAATCIVFALVGCAHTSPPPPIANPDPRICAAIEAAPPIQGGIVQPVTQEQEDAVTAFLRGEAELWGYAGRGWFRAGLAKDQYCK